MSNVAMLSAIHPRTHYTRHLFSGIAKAAPAVTLLTYDDAAAPELAQSLGGAKVVGLWKNSWRLPFLLRRYCRAHSISVLHVQHEFNMYHRNYRSGALIFLLSLLFVRSSVKKVIVTMHAVVSKRQLDPNSIRAFELPAIIAAPLIFRMILNAFYRAVILLSDVIVVHNSGLRDVLVSQYGGSPKRCKVIPHGIAAVPDPSLVRAEDAVPSRFEELGGKKIIFTFGYLVRRKGIEDLLRAFAAVRSQLEGWVVVVSGKPLGESNEYKLELLRLAESLHLGDSVRFPGFLSEHELQWLLHRSEIVVAPHAVSVSSSGVVALAIGAGKPVIVTDQPAFRELLEENRSGLFFKSGDAAALSEKILSLARDPELRARLSKGTVELRERLSWSNIAKIHAAELYE